jgi:hypothetical protein
VRGEITGAQTCRNRREISVSSFYDRPHYLHPHPSPCCTGGGGGDGGGGCGTGTMIDRRSCSVPQLVPNTKDAFFGEIGQMLELEGEGDDGSEQEE